MVDNPQFGRELSIHLTDSTNIIKAEFCGIKSGKEVWVANIYDLPFEHESMMINFTFRMTNIYDESFQISSENITLTINQCDGVIIESPISDNSYYVDCVLLPE